MAVRYGTSGRDSITGTNDDDTLFGWALGASTSDTGVDTLRGFGGDDWLYGGGGNDILQGDADNDTLNGGAGGDQLLGGTGIDTASFIGATVGVSLNLLEHEGYTGDAAGDIYLSIENVQGSAGHDTIVGDNIGNELWGNDGDDQLVGLDGSDHLHGGQGIDYLYGGRERDYLFGDANNDILHGDTGDDWLDGGADVDRLYGEDGDDTFNDGTGNDFAYGGAGADWFVSSAGADTLDGGSGIDTIDFRSSTFSEYVDLGLAIGGIGDADGDIYTGIENVVGGVWGDQFWGNDVANVLKGMGGGDLLRGRGGDDWLYGGEGADVLHGGLEADHFVYESLRDSTWGSIDQILDFTHSAGDRISLGGIDADNTILGDQPFRFTGLSAFSDSNTPGELIVRTLGEDWWQLMGDVNGDHDAELVIWVHTEPGVALEAGDFWL
jgi:serralysin